MPDHIKQLLDKMDGIQSLRHEIQLRLGLLLHTNEKIGKEKIEFLIELAKVNAELEEHYVKVRKLSSGSRSEDRCLARIRRLEDARFQLLHAINGTAIDDYNILPPATVEQI